MRTRLVSVLVSGVIAAALVWATDGATGQWIAWIMRSASPDIPVASNRPSPQPRSLPVAATPPATSQSTPIAGTDSSISAVPVRLYLLGVERGRNPSEGTARIGTNVDNPQSYSAGALLANGALLAEIHSDHVVLTRAGQSATLYLYDRRHPSSAAVAELLMVGASVPATPKVQLTREVLTDVLRPSPVYVGATLRGYQLYPGAKRQMFAQLGLQAGDVITAIDGQPVVDAQQTIQTLRTLTEGAALSVLIERQGRPERLTLDGSMLVVDEPHPALGQALSQAQ